MTSAPATAPLQEGETRILADGTKIQLVRKDDGTKVIRKYRKKQVIQSDKQVKEGEVIVRPDGRRVRVVARRKVDSGAQQIATNKDNTSPPRDGEIRVRPDGTKYRVVRRRKVVEGSPALQTAPEQKEAAAKNGGGGSPTATARESAEATNQERDTARAQEPQTTTQVNQEPALKEPSWVLVNSSNKTTTNSNQTIRVKLSVGSINGTCCSKESGEEKLTPDELVGLLLQTKDSVVVQISAQDEECLGKIAPKFELRDISAAGTNEEQPPKANAPTSHSKQAEEEDPTTMPATCKVPAGMELVPKDVAEAGRTVKELGVVDIKSLVSGETEALLKELKFANRKKAKLEQQLIQAGIAPADDMPYEEAKERLIKIGQRLLEIGSNDVVHPDPVEQAKLREEYYTLTCEMERVDAALVLTEEYQREQEEQEEAWERKHAAGNEQALRQIRRHMPLNCGNMTLQELTTTPTPNGKSISKAMARKFKRTSVLKLVRLHPDNIEKQHPVFFNSLGVMGMTLTERRAVHAQLRKVAPKWKANQTETNCGLKWKWYQLLRDNLKVALEDYVQHCQQCGPPDCHECHLIGLQCPLKADKKTDYSGDLGFPEEEEYLDMEVAKVKDDPGAQALQEALALAKKKAENERSEGLKKHYKSVLAVSLANGSCVAIDQAMDLIERREMEWVENMVERGAYTDDEKRKELIAYTKLLNELKRKAQDLSERAGVETKGAKSANKPQTPSHDPRSAIECALCEELKECADGLCLFVEQRMDAMQFKDARVSQTVNVIRSVMFDLHSRNIRTLDRLGQPIGGRSRKLRSIEEVEREVRARALMSPSITESDVSDSESEEDPFPSASGSKRSLPAVMVRKEEEGNKGGLLAAIASRNKPNPAKMGGGLLAAIAAARG